MNTLISVIQTETPAGRMNPLTGECSVEMIFAVMEYGGLSMAKQGKRRCNPNRRPAQMTEATVRKLKERATDEAMLRALRLVLYTIIDKHGAPKEDIQQLAGEINYTADSILRGYLRWEDIDRVLDEEYALQIDLR